MIHPPRIKNWSITFRLSLYFALTSLLLMASIGIYLSTTLDRRLNDEHSIFLADDIDAIRVRLSSVKGEAPLKEDPRWQETITPVGSRLHLAIIGDNNENLAATSALTMPLPELPPAAQ